MIIPNIGDEVILSSIHCIKKYKKLYVVGKVNKVWEYTKTEGESINHDWYLRIDGDTHFWSISKYLFKTELEAKEAGLGFLDKVMDAEECRRNKFIDEYKELITVDYSGHLLPGRWLNE